MSLLRVGLDGKRPPVLDAVRSLGVPVLVSANNLWDNERHRFRDTSYLDGLDVALDSGGFVAMSLYGRFRFSVRAYLGLVARLRPTWYASMDFCCEEDCPIGGTSTWQRQVATMQLYGTLVGLAREMGLPPPMPVLQGWEPGDYERSAAFLWQCVHWNHWPEIIGIGSVCRREIDGPAGVVRVVEHLDACLPAQLRFHLFGVKGDAARALAGHRRFASMDSIAYDRGNRHDHAKSKASRTNAARAAALIEWHARQREPKCRRGQYQFSFDRARNEAMLAPEQRQGSRPR